MSEVRKIAEPLGRRAQQKLDKRERIKQAAMDLFATDGFEKTTTKAVAERAEVASGTLFLYAKDKADLLFLVMHDWLAEAVERGFSTMPPSLSLVDQWMHVFGEIFRVYQEHPELGAAFVRVLPGSNGPNAQRVNAMTFSFLHRIASLVIEAQGRGEASSSVDPWQAAANVFALYFGALMSWLQGFTSIENALQILLRSSLSLQFQGLRP